MPSFLAPDQEIVIDGVPYLVCEHPVAPGMPHGQEGRQAVVYRMMTAGRDAADFHALKVFKPRYQVPAMVSLSGRLAAFAGLPGLAVCRRKVIDPPRHARLLRRHPGLAYAVLMPWIEGPTWMEVVLEQTELLPEQSLKAARALADVLAGLEERDLAQCDLSGPNLIMSGLAAGWTGSGPVNLVDVEQMFGPGLDRPGVLPGGSPGYAHRTAEKGLWSPAADRFAGAVLLAEILGWCDGRVRRESWGESYFLPKEMHRDALRYRTLDTALGEIWGDGVQGLLARAWRSETLTTCPAFAEWLRELQVLEPAGPLLDAAGGGSGGSIRVASSVAPGEGTEPGGGQAGEMFSSPKEGFAGRPVHKPVWFGKGPGKAAGTGENVPVDPDGAGKTAAVGREESSEDPDKSRWDSIASWLRER